MKKFLSNFEEIIAGIALIILIILVCINVILRFATSKSINWLEEIVFMCFAYIIFLGASAAFKRNLHSGIDLFVKKLPPKAQAVVSACTTVFLLITCIAITYLSFTYAAASGMKKTPILRIPYFYIDISATLGFGLMCIHCLSFIKNIFQYRDYYREKQIYPDIYQYDSAEDAALDELTAHERERGDWE